MGDIIESTAPRAPDERTHVVQQIRDGRTCHTQHPILGKAPRKMRSGFQSSGTNIPTPALSSVEDSMTGRVAELLDLMSRVQQVEADIITILSEIQTWGSQARASSGSIGGYMPMCPQNSSQSYQFQSSSGHPLTYFLQGARDTGLQLPVCTDRSSLGEVCPQVPPQYCSTEMSNRAKRLCCVVCSL